MKITELLQESQQLDEGPITQAVGKVGGKIAKGIANVGKDLKTGFKAGFSGEQPAAAPGTPAPAADAAAPTQTAPVKKAAPAPAAEPETPAPAKTDNTVPQLQKQLAAAEARIQKLNDDTMENLSMLMRRISSLEKQVQGENPNIVQSNNSIEPTGNSVTESIQLFKR